MTEYVPDRWCVIRIPNNRETVYKVFASWSGGYIGGDSWKLNSGIVRADLIGIFKAAVAVSMCAAATHMVLTVMVLVCSTV